MSDNHPLLIYGTSQHGRVVAEAADAADRTVLGFVDQTPRSDRIGRWPVFRDMLRDIGRAAFIVAIGDNMARRRISSDLGQVGLPEATVVHPTAWVSPSAQVGGNVYIGAQCVVNAGAQVAAGAIINTGAIIEHDCVIGAYSHIASGAVLASGVHVGELCLIGAGAAIKPGMRIGDDCIVGAGAAVIEHVPRNQTFVGVPAASMAQRFQTATG